MRQRLFRVARVAIASAVAIAVTSSSPRSQSITGLDAQVAALVASISQARLQQLLPVLVAFGTRDARSATSDPRRGNRAAGQWIYDELLRSGSRLQVSFDVHQVAKGEVAGFPEGSTASWADMAVRTGIETGQWPQWMEFPAGKMTFARFTEDYGRVLAARHKPQDAAAALAAMKTDRAVLATSYAKEYPDDGQTLPWLDRAVAQAEAVVVLANDRAEEGISMIRKAAEAETALPPPFGPPMLQKPSYEMLGDELLALGRRTEAADAYKRALAAAPNRRLSVAGLKAATTP